METQKPKETEIKLSPIGAAYKTARGDVMKIVIYDRYSEGLDGIEDLDYIYVLYWMHKLSEKDRKTLKVHPQGDRNDLQLLHLRRRIRYLPTNLKFPPKITPITYLNFMGKLLYRHSHRSRMEEKLSMHSSPCFNSLYAYRFRV